MENNNRPLRALYVISMLVFVGAVAILLIAPFIQPDVFSRDNIESSSAMAKEVKNYGSPLYPGRIDEGSMIDRMSVHIQRQHQQLEVCEELSKEFDQLVECLNECNQTAKPNCEHCLVCQSAE